MLGWILKTGIIATTRYKKSIQLFWSIIPLLIPFNHAIILLAEAVLTGEKIVVFTDDIPQKFRMFFMALVFDMCKEKC